jgi:hypothetical protein
MFQVAHFDAPPHWGDNWIFLQVRSGTRYGALLTYRTMDPTGSIR